MSDMSATFSQHLHFVSSGMDSNSQTSQELLIPNDVRTSNTRPRGFSLVVHIFFHLNDKKEKTGNQCSPHMYAAQEQVTLSMIAAAANKIGRDFKGGGRRAGNFLITLIILTPD